MNENVLSDGSVIYILMYYNQHGRFRFIPSTINLNQNFTKQSLEVIYEFSSSMLKNQVL